MLDGRKNGDYKRLFKERRASAARSTLSSPAAVDQLEQLADEWDNLEEPEEPDTDVSDEDEEDGDDYDEYESEIERIRDEAEGLLNDMPE